MAANILLAACKLAAGILGHSQALTADGIESLADVFSSIIVWRGLVVAEAPPDEEHPYGHGKAEPIAAAIVATMLLLAAAWIALASIREIMAEDHSPPAAFTLAVLVAVIAIKEALFRFVGGEGRKLDSTAIRSDAWHHRSDAITSLAAGIGISVALVGGRGFEGADDVAAVVAAGIVAWNGWRLLRPALGELMDASPSPEVIARISALARETPGVDAVETCRVRKTGYQYFVDMHVEVDPQMTVLQSHKIAHDVKDAVRRAMPAVRDVLVHVEPRGLAARRRQRADGD